MRSFDTVKTLVDLFERSASAFGARELFGTKLGGAWVFLSYAQVKRLVDDLRAGLASLGVSPQDRVAVISNNRVEWPIAAYATYGLGAAFVPMYESQLERDWEYIVRDSGAKVLFVANSSIYRRVRHFVGAIPTLQHVVVLSNEDGELSYSLLLESGSRSPVPPLPVDPDAVASLLYTSGTTGDPKGVKLSHRNVVANVGSVQHALPVDEHDRSLAFLPWAHSFGHTAELHMFVSIGASVAICEGTDKILANLGEVRPTILLAVPRVFNRLYMAIDKQIQAKPKPVRKLFHEGLTLALRRRDGETLTALERATLALADKLLFSRVRARFGGRLRYAVSGAAALSREVADFVDAVGITVCEGYGLTEASPIVAVNVPEHRRAGSVGRPVEGVRVSIDRSVTGDAVDGEIVVYGANVMLGYHNRPQETRAALTEDGGLRTGDMGYIEDDFLHVTGRIKEQYKLENGKYVVPAPLEDTLKLSPFVANVMLYGDNRPFNVAVVVPDLKVVREWAASQGIPNGSKEALFRDERIRTKIANELETRSGGFKSYEKVRRFLVITEEFTQENEMLTPSLKVKRRNVLRRWGQQIAGLYDGSPPPSELGRSG